MFEPKIVLTIFYTRAHDRLNVQQDVRLTQVDPGTVIGPYALIRIYCFRFQADLNVIQSFFRLRTATFGLRFRQKKTVFKPISVLFPLSVKVSAGTYREKRR